MTVKNACGTASDTLEIARRTIVLDSLPNIITPNDDSFNQHFVVGKEIGLCRLLVYNRWGDMVYQSVDYKNNWDAPGLSSGIYYYRLRGDCIEEVKGSITISR